MCSFTFWIWVCGMQITCTIKKIPRCPVNFKEKVIRALLNSAPAQPWSINAIKPFQCYKFRTLSSKGYCSKEVQKLFAEKKYKIIFVPTIYGDNKKKTVGLCVGKCFQEFHRKKMCTNFTNIRTSLIVSRPSIGNTVRLIGNLRMLQKEFRLPVNTESRTKPGYDCFYLI